MTKRERRIAKLTSAELNQRAWSYVWRHHGRGLSTAVGIHTRRLIRDAFAAGWRANQRKQNGRR